MGGFHIYSLALSLVFSLGLMPLLIRLSNKLKLIDNPHDNDRKLHKAPMPHSGGLGIVLASALTVVIILPLNDSLVSLFVSCLVIVGFGLVDDIVELSPGQKLAAQAVGVIVAMMGGMVIQDIPFLPDAPLWFSYAFTFLLTTAVINGVNFSDGMDGLAAGTSLMGLILIFILAVEASHTQAAVITLSLVGALIGFLRYNTHPAAIFMGDTGSQFLGLILMWLAVDISQTETSEISRLLPILILGIPLMDILQVVPVRIKKGLPLPGPDKEHFHHQIAKLGFPQAGVVAIIYTLQAILLSGAYFSRHQPDWVVAAFFATYVVLNLGALYLAHVTHWKISGDQARERRNTLLRQFSEYHPYTGTLYAMTVAAITIVAALVSSDINRKLAFFAVLLASVLLTLKLLLRKRFPLMLVRATAYFCVAFAVYGISISIHNALSNHVLNVFFAALAVMLLLSIRTTRKAYFGLTPQDLLVVLFVIILAPALPLDLGQSIHISEVVFRTATLLYACEYIIARGKKTTNILFFSSIISMLLLVINI